MDSDDPLVRITNNLQRDRISDYTKSKVSCQLKLKTVKMVHHHTCICSHSKSPHLMPVSAIEE